MEKKKRENKNKLFCFLGMSANSLLQVSVAKKKLEHFIRFVESVVRVACLFVSDILSFKWKATVPHHSLL